MPKDKPETVDLSAVARVARSIDLRDIRVIQVEAECSPAPDEPLEPQINVESSGVLVSESQLNVVCGYTLTIKVGGVQAAKCEIVYLMRYEVVGDTFAEQDIEHFASANGVYHSWPFLRQFVFDLTSKMGFPPLTLPVFQVLPRAQAKKVIADKGDAPTPEKKVKPKVKKSKPSQSAVP